MLFRYYSFTRDGGTCVQLERILYNENDYIDVDDSWKYIIINNRKYNIDKFDIDNDIERYNYGGFRGPQDIKITRYNVVINNKKLTIIEHDSGYDVITINRIEYNNKSYKMK